MLVPSSFKLASLSLPAPTPHKYCVLLLLTCADTCVQQLKVFYS